MHIPIKIAGDFNAQDNEICIRDFIGENNLKNIVKEPTCFKNPVNPTCIDLYQKQKRLQKRFQLCYLIFIKWYWRFSKINLSS